MKRILDTVHGYIMVDEKFMDHIIDTPLFQRLRRIEQTSIRCVFPSARHDRFIHSLGVFHIGGLIVNQLRIDALSNNNWNKTEAVLETIYGSYLSACLLHDIAHAPFSHTFEKYYGQKNNLAVELKKLVANEIFSNDLESTIENNEPNFHEYASAIVVYKKYRDDLRILGYDVELVIRMITGIYYRDDVNNQIHNCFISLLHGEIFDADRLDYACRDVWASGYSTSTIDLRRLISSLHIKKNKENIFVVCFESNSLNEIESILNVKDFQTKYALNHHVVVYDNYLLQQAAEFAALYYLDDNNTQENSGYLALNKIVNINNLIDEVLLNNNLKISLLSDDDLIFLMKQSSGNTFYKQWCSRKYIHFALWKSIDEFYYYFPNTPKGVSLKNSNFEEVVKNKICENGDYEYDDIQVNEVTFKCRIKLDSLYLVVANEVSKYTDIKPIENSKSKDIVFYYVYVKKKDKDRKTIRSERKRIVESLKGTVADLYSK